MKKTEPIMNMKYRYSSSAPFYRMQFFEDKISYGKFLSLKNDLICLSRIVSIMCMGEY